MEQIYTIKVKRKYDPRSQYPSERRYSASTIFGLAWVHLALACTSFLLACLALYNPIDPDELFSPTPAPNILNTTELQLLLGNESDSFSSASSYEEIDFGNAQMLTGPKKINELPDHLKRESFVLNYSFILVLSPCLLALSGFAAGFAAIVASKRWYVDNSIAWFLLSSILATILSLVALGMIILWVVAITDNRFCDYFANGSLFKKTHFEVDENESTNENGTLYYVVRVPLEELRARRIPLLHEETKGHQSRKVLSINILIAAVVEFIWSLLSLKLAWCGTISSYPDDDTRSGGSGGNTVHIVTEIKGNNTKRLPKNTKILPPQPDLVKDDKIQKFIETQRENGGFFMNTTDNGDVMVQPSAFSRRESSAEYRERMMNYLNKCNPSKADAPESQNNSLNSAEVPQTESAEESLEIPTRPQSQCDKSANRLSVMSWGDVHEFPVYNQNNLDLEKIGIHLPKVESPVPDEDKN